MFPVGVFYGGMIRDLWGMASIFMLSISLMQCATFPNNGTEFEHQDGIIQDDSRTSWERWLVENATYWEGRGTLEWAGRSFNLDCTGVVMASYFKSGWDLWPDMAPFSGGGVLRLYSWLDSEGRIFDQPRPGDLIFWDNTWDANDNYQWDDPLTHVGLVLEIEEDGRIVYLHHNYSKGVVRAYMHLERRDDYMEDQRILNSPMRMRYPDRPRPEKWLSSHLLRGFGRPAAPESGL